MWVSKGAPANFRFCERDLLEYREPCDIQYRMSLFHATQLGYSTAQEIRDLFPRLHGLVPPPDEEENDGDDE